MAACLSSQEIDQISSAKSYLEWGEVPRTLSTLNHYAYLKVAEGCKKRCAFCIIPAIKGPLKSKTESQVLKEFQELLDFVQEMELDQVGVFLFSLEKEAYAANLPNQISEEVKIRRFQALTGVLAEISEKNNKAMIGKKLTAIVEGVHPDSEYLLRARHQGQCPEIDGQIILNDARVVDSFGALYEEEITDLAGYDLIGRAIRPVQKKSSNPLALV